jgi:phage virion morphogenesis protein
MNVTLDDAAAQAMLRRVEEGARDARGLFTEIGSALEASARERIETTKVGPDGIPWVPISEEWIDYKREKKHAPGILTMRGDLLNSIAFEAAPAFVDLVAGPSDYAAIHQFGGEPGMAPGAAAIPARPYLGLSDADAQEIQEATAAWLADLTEG